MDFESLLSSVACLFSEAKTIVVVTDGMLKCRWANQSALKQFPTLALPDGLLDLVRSIEPESLLKILSGGDFYCTSINNEPFNKLDVSFLPVTSKEKLIGCIVIFRSMDYMGIKTDEADAENVLASFSNGYKMPLTIIFSTLGLMARRMDDETDGTMKNYLRLITQNCYRLLRLSNNLTSISRYRSGLGKIRKSNGDICRFLAGLCNAVSVLTASLDIPLETEIPNKDIILSFDPDKLSVALLNIISNSCKYTREGNAIRVRLEVMEQQVVISVTDRGKGIRADKLQYIFDPYFTFEPDGKPYGGIGLGLTMVKYIILMHAGTVAVQSVEGTGTTVAFTLPLHRDESLPDYTAENGADYLADRFSPLFVELSDVCRCPLP